MCWGLLKTDSPNRLLLKTDSLVPWGTACQETEEPERQFSYDVWPCANESQFSCLYSKGLTDLIFCVRILVANVQNPIQNGLSQKGNLLVCVARNDAKAVLIAA